MPKLRQGSLARPAAFLALAGGAVQIASALVALVGATAGGVAFGSFSPALTVALFATGSAATAAALFSLRGERIAWAFAISLHGTLFVVLLLAAPKIHGVGVPGLAALLPALACGVITALFALAADDY